MFHERKQNVRIKYHITLCLKLSVTVRERSNSIDPVQYFITCNCLNEIYGSSSRKAVLCECMSRASRSHYNRKYGMAGKYSRNTAYIKIRTAKKTVTVLIVILTILLNVCV